MSSSPNPKPFKVTVEVYRKAKKLSPVKTWDRYLHMSHAQYHGGCHHYAVPEDMVEAALSQGAHRLTSAFSCGEL